MGIKDYYPRYTLEEFLEEEKKVEYPLEYLNGYIYAKSFTSIEHNTIISNIMADLVYYLKGKDCRAFSEQIEVIMGKDRVKPDIFVVCKENNEFKKKGQSFLTIPTMIFEVVSKSNSSLDTITKMELYAKFGVKEYNLVYQEGYVQQYKLTEDETYYLNKAYDIRDEYKSIEFEDFTCRLQEIFDFL